MAVPTVIYALKWLVNGCNKLEHEIFASHPVPCKEESLTNLKVKQPDVFDQEAGILIPFGKVESLIAASKGELTVGPS